jgi:hypothetical protein
MITEINNCHLQNGETIAKSAFMIAELAPNSVRTYRLAPEGFNVVRKKLLGQRAIIFTGIIVFTIIITFRQLDMDWQRVSFVSLAPYFILTMLLIGALATGLLKGMKQNREAWNTYELIIGEDFLIRRIKNFPELEIRRHEITSIKESPAGLQVETSSRDRTIGIASSLVDYEDARARLSQWMTPTANTTRMAEPCSVDDSAPFARPAAFRFVPFVCKELGADIHRDAVARNTGVEFYTNPKECSNIGSREAYVFARIPSYLGCCDKAGHGDYQLAITTTFFSAIPGSAQFASHRFRLLFYPCG